jgi:hypothetical protein
MQHYDYLEKLEDLWKPAVERYRNGNTSPKTILKDREEELLAAVGLNVMDLFDYVEDLVLEGEPGWNTFAAICEVRRNYFLERQNCILSSNRVKMDELPPKSEALRGITWLPRIIPKAIGKLRGELSADIMYCCGGDRNFFNTHDIHPAEFLRVAWAFENSPDKIVDWVTNRTK